MKNISEPTVSVVVPVYNVEDYLVGCIDSVTEQTYKNLEIILVDDGATDSSGRMCDEIAETDSRIKVIHKKNGGLSDARNVGTEAALGELLMYVDSDDRIAPEMVEVLLESLRSANADVAICEPVHVFGSDQPEYSVSSETKTLTPEEAICEMWYQTSFLPSAWAKLYKTELIKKVEFRVGILYEDIDMMHKVFASAEAIAYNSSRLYAYQHREGSITTNTFSLRDCEILNICDRIKSYAADKSEALQKAARAYGVVGALRVELNAPDTEEFAEAKNRARDCLKSDRKSVMADKNVRRKTKIGLLLYTCCRPLMHLVYGRINRWK